MNNIWFVLKWMEKPKSPNLGAVDMHGLVSRIKLRVSLTVTVSTHSVLLFILLCTGCFIMKTDRTVCVWFSAWLNQLCAAWCRLWRVFFTKQSESLFRDASERHHNTQLVESRALSRTPKNETLGETFLEQLKKTGTCFKSKSPETPKWFEKTLLTPFFFFGIFPVGVCANAFSSAATLKISGYKRVQICLFILIWELGASGDLQ